MIGHGRESVGANVTVGQVSESALVDLFTRLDKVLANSSRFNNLRVETVRTNDAPVQGAPSWTDGMRISLLRDTVRDAISFRGTHMLALFGLNYHELAHVLFTPQLSSTSRQWLQASNVRAMLYNILEDARIEHMIRQEYQRMTVYFMAAVNQHILSEKPPRDYVGSFVHHVLLAERRYLPRDLRQEVRTHLRTFPAATEQKVTDAEAILVRYVRRVHLTSLSMIPPEVQKDVDDLAEIIFGPNWFQANPPMQIKVMCKDISHTHDKKKAPSGQVKAYEEIEGDDHGEDEAESSGGQGESKPGKAGRGFSVGRQQVLAALKDAEENEEVRRDMKLADSAVTEAKFRLPDLPKQYSEKASVTAPMRRARDLFSAQFNRLQAMVDPGWETEQAQGRLNLNRAMRGVDPDTVFDSWIEDQSDALSIEAKILADVSGSMAGGTIIESSKGLWVIASALSRIGAATDLIAYSDASWQIKPPNTRESDTQFTLLHPVSGTNPRTGIAKSKYDLGRSQASHKLFLIYTDGGWSNRHDDADIKAMRDAGVTTVLVFMSPRNSGYGPGGLPVEYRHGVEHYYDVSTGEQLATVARKIVVAMMSKSVAAIGR